MAHTESEIETLDFETDNGLGARARVGLIVLQTDQTVEHELARIFNDRDVALYHARIPNAMEVTPATLRQMEQDLPRAAALLPPDFGFDAIGYACTSGATMIGEQQVDRIIRRVHPGARTSNPLTACKAALSALELARIALVTPYAPDVTLQMQDILRAAGVEVGAVASFGQSDDFIVARITPASILRAMLRVGANDSCEGIFVACTSLRALEIIPEAEARLGKPVISSNQALAWHLMRLAGDSAGRADLGRLFRGV